MAGRLINKVLSRYSHRSYEQRGKVRSMFILDLFLVPSFTIIFIGMNIIMPRPLFDSFNIMIAVFLAVNIASIILIWLGYYNTAVNIFIFAVVFGLMFNTYGTTFKGSPERFVASLAPWSAAIIFSCYFCSMRVFLAVNVLQIIAYVILIFNLTLVNAPVQGIVFFDFLINMVLSSMLCYSSIRINSTARALRKEETDQEREKHLEINRTLLQSMREISAELDSSSGRMFTTTDSFSRNIGDQAASIEEITATMEEISGGSENLSTGAGQQSNAIKSLLSLMGDLSAITKDIESKTAATLTRTKDIASKAQSGDSYIREMNYSMSEINTTSQEMTGIASMISDISDKINLLSLNASIEAARAGEYGRGFAVVADEVSKLADQTSSSVKDIDRLIKKSEDEINRGMNKVQDTVAIISEIITGVNEINQMMGTLGTNMERYLKSHEEVNRQAEFVKSRSDEIRIAAEEQKKAAEETTKTIGGINELSQSNSTWAEDMLLLSKAIADRARDIRDKIGSFDLTSLDLVE